MPGSGELCKMKAMHGNRELSLASRAPGGKGRVPGGGLGAGVVLGAALLAGIYLLVSFLARETGADAATFSMEFVRIPPGSFMMGCPEGSSVCSVSEEPYREVTITKPFELGKYEVTQEQWQAIMGSNPSFFPAARKPVEMVSWHDAQEFLNKLNARDDGYRYRLPTEAEWEYAARAGSAGRYYGKLEDVAWFRANSDYGPHEVGTRQANAWGLHDMLGNVWEWCQDWHAIDAYAKGVNQDPTGPGTGTHKVLRGGSWERIEAFLRVYVRDSLEPTETYSYVGFRCLREKI